MKKIFNFAILTSLFLAFAGVASPAFADCQSVYGGGQTCITNFAFTINKLVQVPGKGGGQFVDNLSVNDPKYSPSQNVNYEIIVTNTGSQTIPTISVTDAFPQFITFVSGVGNYNKNTNTLTFTITHINPGQSLTYVLTAKTADVNTLPSDQGITCVVNQVSAVDSNGNTDSDSSQVCIQKAVLAAVAPVKTTPATGPEMLPLALLFPGALGGLLLRKKSTRISATLKGGAK